MADEPTNQKTCVLRASIHCQGCNRKVKKILSQLPGVEYVDVDSKLQKVTVIGNVAADALIQKLAKSGKKAELWPQIYQKSLKITAPNSGKKKAKEIESHAEAPSSSDNGTTLEASTEVEAATSNSQGSGAPVKANDGGGGGGGGGRDESAVTGPSVKADGDVQEKKLEEESKSEESCSVVKEKEAAVEKSNGGGGGKGGESGGTSVKRKKKKGQSGNPAPSAHRGLENHEPGPPQGTNESPPRNHDFPPPPALQPVYAVSYNTAYPSSSYTSSHYSAPPPHAYAYMHPPPLDPEVNPRQPLDSFEIFSDENPNGCFIM